MKLTLAIVLLVGACGGGGSKPADTTPVVEEHADASPPPDDESEQWQRIEGSQGYQGDPAPALDQASLDAGGTGSVDCDALITRTRCLFKATPDVPAEAIKGFEDSIPAWKEALQNEGSRQPTIDGCKIDLDAYHDSYAQTGC